MSVIKKIIRAVFHPLGLEVVNKNSYEQNQIVHKTVNEQRDSFLAAIDRLENMVVNSRFPVNDQFNEFNFFKFSCGKMVKSKSQLFQDLFVLYFFNSKQGGFFVEFGATDGVTLSNTFLLEKEYGWKGILCEPGKVWHNALPMNRNCVIDYRCVWSKTGEQFKFNESNIAELSTLEMFKDVDFHAESRKDGDVYTVETISFTDLLDHYNAPRVIDYLSIDTEGSEFEILNSFDFSKYDIRIITVEHNFSSMREDLFNLLVKNGYKRVFDSISAFDDWYVKVSA